MAWKNTSRFARPPVVETASTQGKEDTVVYPKRVAWKPAISAHAQRRVSDEQRELVEASLLGVARVATSPPPNPVSRIRL
jgi:hypothetical protein